MKKLNDEQRQMVEENHNLIYAIINKLGLPTDEYYGIAAEALCNAARLYKPGSGVKFTTYACKSIENMCFSQQVKNGLDRNIPKDKLTYLDATWKADDGQDFKSDVSFHSPENIENDAIFRTIYNDTIQKLPEKHQEMVGMLMQGYRLKDVGEKYGISRERVRQIFAVFRDMMCVEFKHG